MPLPPASDACPQRAGVYFVDPNKDFDEGRPCDCSWTEKWPCGADDASRCWSECCGHSGNGLPEGYVPGDILRSDRTEAVTYYAYRATNKDDFPIENVNLANLEGIMMYLQHEVISQDGKGSYRKFNIDRIRRYRISMKSTTQVLSLKPTDVNWPTGVKPQYTTFSAFDWGQIAQRNSGLPSVGCGSTEIRRWGIYDNQAYGDNVR